jgi:hypothetical protein
MSVIVTPPTENFRVAKALTRENEELWSEIELGAAFPRQDGHYPAFLDEVVHQMCARSLGPTAALGVTARVLQGTNWAGYRSGKARLASGAASYLTWLAPPAEWSYVPLAPVGERRPVGWRSPGGELIADVLAGDNAYVRRFSAASVKAAVPDVAAVRVLNLLAPRHSVALLASGKTNPLVDTPWWFEGGQR